MRRIAIIAIAAAGLALAACSQDTTEDLEQNVEQAGAEIKEGAQDIWNDPDVQEAGSAIKDAAEEGGAALKDAAGELGDAAREAGDENQAEVPPEDKADVSN